MGPKCRLVHISLGHPAINQGAKTRIPPTDTLRPAHLGAKTRRKYPPAKSLKRRLKRHLPNNL